MLSLEEQLKIIKRGTVEIINEEELRKKLEKGEPLVVKAGFDPTAPDLHLGHTVLLRKMRHFQELGHKVVFLIGDFTARIGDPSGRSEMRKPLTLEEIERNAATYKRQFFKVLDPDKTIVAYNSHWLEGLSFADLIKLAGKFTVAQFLEREDFAKRFSDGKPIGLHELLYPIAQAYDSVALKSDVELGGTDQKFNLLVGRELQRYFGQEPQIAVLMPILEGLDGVQKMSKSLGNYVGIDEPPVEMFGKIMSIPDSLMIKYFELLTDFSIEEIEEFKKDIESGKIHPKELKMKLAFNLVKTYHSEEDAMRAKEEFEKVFSKKELPSEIPLKTFSEKEKVLIDLLVEGGLISSKGEAKRLLSQGGVRVDGVKVEDPYYLVNLGQERIIQVGKRKFLKVRGGEVSVKS
ncbi:MAG: tyrosine--tRNA ligase [Synergistetes bacterium]|nr:tyrosine--tRNA ligase [Synergistota bacterium]